MRFPAATLLQKITAKIFLTIAMTVYLPSLFVYTIHPGQWWGMGILSIGFPYTWLLFSLAVVIAFRMHKTMGCFFLLAWLCGFIIMKNVVGIHSNASWKMEKANGVLRVMQWNCMQMEGIEKEYTKSHPLRFESVQFIRKYNPDIIMLQDFQDTKSDVVRSNTSLLRDTLGYKYFIIQPYFHCMRPWGEIKEGTAIFSKLPFTDTGAVTYTGRRFPESITWASVQWQNKTVRLISTHFQSMNLNTPKNKPDIIEYHQYEDSMVVRSGDLLRKLKFYQPYHVTQANRLRTFFDSCSMPVIVGCDLNSVPSSYVYHNVKGQLQDAFLQGGFGLGKSFQSPLPNLRIDYLFTAPALKILQSTTVPVRFSDHNPVIADLQWR